MATTGSWDDVNHTKLIDVPTHGDRFRVIPALTMCFKHFGIKEYHVMMEANMWKGKTDEGLGNIKKGEPMSVLIVLSCHGGEARVTAFDTMTMTRLEDFGEQVKFESVWSGLMNCPDGAFDALPKEAIPLMEEYWNNYPSIQI